MHVQQSALSCLRISCCHPDKRKAGCWSQLTLQHIPGLYLSITPTCSFPCGCCVVAECSGARNKPPALAVCTLKRVPRLLQRAHQQTENNAANIPSKFPPSLMRRYEVYLHPRLGSGTLRMRSVTSSHVGRLVKVKVSNFTFKYKFLTALCPSLHHLVARRVACEGQVELVKVSQAQG